MQIGHEETQVIVTVSLIAVSGITALLCDYLRIRSFRTRRMTDLGAPLQRRVEKELLRRPVRLQQPPRKAAAPGLLAAIARGTRLAGPAVLPKGMQNKAALSLLVRTGFSVTGAAISISVTRDPANRTPGFQDSFQALMESLIGPEDFAAPVGVHEFLLIFPEDDAGKARGRITHVGRQLGDQQLRFFAQFGAYLHFGGTAVDAQPMGETIASAQAYRNRSAAKSAVESRTR